MKYIVLLRGINISGKNKISMNELKAGLEKIGFENVSTYLNSGNAIFQSEIDNTIGEPKENLEKIQEYNNIIFWSYKLKEYGKTNWWSKTASTSISDKITIRTANTMRKVLELCNK